METLFLQVTQLGLGSFLINLVVVAALAMLAANYLKGIYIKDFGAAFLLALVLAVLNATAGWVLRGLAWPVNLITFGLFSGIINLAISTFLIWIADRFLKGFEAKNLFWTFVFALVLAVGTFFINLII
ncbi:MAG: phage holin family protein [Bacteroidota bacterium]